jgi:hypothetical protein
MRTFKINNYFSFGMAALFTVIATARAPAVNIDTFDVRVGGMVDGFLVNGGQAAEQRLYTAGAGDTAFSWYKTPTDDTTSVLGGYRDVFVEQMSGGLTTDVSINQQRLGGGRNPELSFSAASDVVSMVTLRYDGPNLGTNIDPNGLGGVNLTEGNANGLLVTFPEVDQPMNLLITIWENGANGTKASQYVSQIGTVASGDPARNEFVPFSNFVIADNSGVTEGVTAPVTDFSNIGAVAYKFNAPGLGGSGTAALDFRADSTATAARVIPEPASAVSFLIGSLGLCFFEAFRLRRKRRGMR